MWAVGGDALTYALSTPVIMVSCVQEKKSDSFTVKRLRPILISLACRHGNAECLKNAKTAFDAWLQDQNTNAVDVNVRQQIYQYGMKSAGETEWNKGKVNVKQKIY